MRPLKLFISLPMNGRTDDEIKKDILTIKNWAEDKYGDIEVIDSFFESAPYDASPLWYLAKSIQFLSTADVAVFHSEWLWSRGCRIEHQCCKEYGIEIIDSPI